MLIMRCAFLPARFVFGAGVMILLPVKALAGTEVHPAAAVGAYKDTGEKSLPFCSLDGPMPLLPQWIQKSHDLLCNVFLKHNKNFRSSHRLS